MSPQKRSPEKINGTFRTFLLKTGKGLERIPRWVLIVFFAVLPALVTLLLVTFALRSTISHFAPVAYNDMTEYWHEIATFNKVGLSGGYYSHMQLIPEVRLFHFGVHGPVYILIVGALSKVIGWSFTTPIYLNMAFIGLAFGLFAWLHKLDHVQILVAGLAVLTCWPVLIFMTSTFQETFHQAMGVLLAGVFGAAIVKLEKVKPWQKVAAVIFIILIALVRYSWALLLIPLLLLYQPRKKWFTVLSVIIALALFAAVFYTYGKVSVPGYSYIQSAISEFGSGVGHGFKSLWQQVLSNLRGFFQFPYITTAINRLVYVGLLLFVFADAIYLLIKGRKVNATSATGPRMREDLVTFFSLFSLFTASFMVYFIDGDIRIFAPLILFSLLLFVQSKRYIPVLVVIVVCLLITPFFVTTYQAMWSPLYNYDRTVLDETRTLLAENIPYESKTSNAWCNTLYLPTALYDYRVAAVPPGIGISYYVNQNNEDLEFPLRPRYVWITDEMYVQLNAENAAQLQKVVEMPDGTGMPGNPPGGTLYLNMVAHCP